MFCILRKFSTMSNECHCLTKFYLTALSYTVSCDDVFFNVENPLKYFNFQVDFLLRTGKDQFIKEFTFYYNV